MTYKLFTTKNCKFCPAIKKYLEHKGKTYIEIDAEPLEVARELQLKYNVLTVPLLVREDGEYAVGLNYAKLSAIM